MKKWLHIDTRLNRKLSEASYLPPKEDLYKFFFDKVEEIADYRYSKFFNKEYLKLMEWELENIRDLIYDFPALNIDDIESKKDFHLECIIPDKVYKVYQTDTNRKSNHLFGVVIADKEYKNGDKINLFYSSRDMGNIEMTLGSGDKIDSRLDLKDKILNIFKR